jgi:hypothetical protein
MIGRFSNRQVSLKRSILGPHCARMEWKPGHFYCRKALSWLPICDPPQSISNHCQRVVSPALSTATAAHTLAGFIIGDDSLVSIAVHPHAAQPLRMNLEQRTHSFSGQLICGHSV